MCRSDNVVKVRNWDRYVPCVPGDCLYGVLRGQLAVYTVHEVRLFSNDGLLVSELVCQAMLPNGYSGYGTYHVLTKQIGKTIFRSKEEAVSYYHLV